LNLISASIAWRYARSRNGSRFLNFITLFSIGGILLGVCALIIVLSVMNGFENQLKHQILGAVPHIIVDNPSEKSLTHAKLSQVPQVKGVSRVSLSQAMIQGDNQLNAVMLQGINPSEELTLNPLAQNMRYGTIESLDAGKYNVIIGRRLARELNVTVGDKIRVISAERSVFTPLGRIPSQRNFTISGVFEMQSEVDSTVAIVHIKDAQRLLRLPKNYQAPYRLFLNDAFDETQVTNKLKTLDSSLSIKSWRSEYGELFSAVSMEKNMMWLMLSLIIAVAAFNIISALVILVTEKQTDIAILSTLGLNQNNIALIFILQGTFNGLIGTLAGSAIGLLITCFLNEILTTLGLNLIVNPVDPSAGLPILINEGQILILVGATVLLSLLATLYPSFKAGRVDPAKALKHD